MSPQKCMFLRGGNWWVLVSLVLMFGVTCVPVDKEVTLEQSQFQRSMEDEMGLAEKGLWHPVEYRRAYQKAHLRKEGFPSLSIRTKIHTHAGTHAHGLSPSFSFLTLISAWRTSPSNRATFSCLSFHSQRMLTCGFLSWHCMGTTTLLINFSSAGINPTVGCWCW